MFVIQITVLFIICEVSNVFYRFNKFSDIPNYATLV
jgi:hypothetical protein